MTRVCYQDWTRLLRLKGPRSLTWPLKQSYTHSVFHGETAARPHRWKSQETGLSDCSFITLMNCWQNIRSMKVHQQRQRGAEHIQWLFLLFQELYKLWPLGVVCRLCELKKNSGINLSFILVQIIATMGGEFCLQELIIHIFSESQRVHVHFLFTLVKMFFVYVGFSWGNNP